MRLGDLLHSAGVAPGGAAAVDLGVEIRAVVADSRQVEPGALFVACSGARVQGTAFVAAAVERGAVAVLAQAPVPSCPVPLIVVPDTRALLGPIAAAFHGHPSRAMKVIGITGTNGKTTTSILLGTLLGAAGHRAAAIGTLGVWTPEGTRAGHMTTPEAPELQRLLAELRDQGFTHVAIEVSSHALDQHRVAGVEFAVKLWTNLSRDHLDYHGTEAAYASAKAKLFRELPLQGAPAFVNGDDPFAAAMGREGHAQAWSFRGDPTAQHQAHDLHADASGLSLRLSSPGHGDLALHAPLVGRHNAENLVASVLACRALGVADADLQRAAAQLQAPRGRLEPVPNSLGALVVVDYAHTPDALVKVLPALRPLVAPGRRLVCLFGCGGDRDRGKRPLMGEVAAHLSDVIIATSDNPRSEQPEAILAAIEEGLVAGGALPLPSLVPSALADLAGRPGYIVEVDRGSAIRRAIGVLGRGDVLLIAGKGHETTQTIGADVRPFDDVAEARRWLSQHRQSGGVWLRPEAFAFDGEIAVRACGGKLRVPGRRWSTGLCTDSRQLGDGSLFVALPGERFDGADFLGEAIAKGAAGIVCARGRGEAFAEAARAGGTFLLEVDDPLVALGRLALDHRTRFQPLCVGVTGSNGKTTTKELTALALGSLGPVLATQGNFNNRIGVPLTLARLGPQHRAAVIEMGMSEPGEIATLCQIAVPRIGIVTSISEAHLEGMGTLAAIADEKMVLPHALPADGVAVLPAEEPLLRERAAGLACRVLWFGQQAGDVHRVGPLRVEGLAQHFTADVAGTRVDVTLPGLGVHLAHNALGALAIALAAGADLDAAAASLARYQPVGQRMLPSQIGPWLVLEDCYNANPRSTEVALDTLASLTGPRVAVLGSMLELGATSHALHARVGRHAAQTGVDLLIAVGPMAAAYAEGARAGGLPAHRVAEVAEPADAAALVADRLPDAGVVLIKGSRGARMERAVAALRALLPESAAPGAEQGRC